MSTVAAKKAPDPKNIKATGSELDNASNRAYQIGWGVFFIIVSVVAIIPIFPFPSPARTRF